MKLLLFSTLMAGWMTYYLCQRTLPSAMTAMINISVNHTPGNQSGNSIDESFTKAYISQLQSLFAVAYSISFLISGIMSDVVNVKIMFSVGLALSGTLLALFPLTEGNHMLGMALYFLFGLSQGCGWPATARILRQTYSPSELGLAWGVMSTASSMASLLSPFLVLSISEAGGWKYSFYIMGLSSLCLSLLVVIAFGMMPAFNGEESKGVSDDTGKVSDSSQSSDSELRWFNVFCYLDLWCVMAMHSILWLVRASILDWGQLYLIQTRGLMKDSAGIFNIIILYTVSKPN